MSFETSFAEPISYHAVTQEGSPPFYQKKKANYNGMTYAKYTMNNKVVSCGGRRPLMPSKYVVSNSSELGEWSSIALYYFI